MREDTVICFDEKELNKLNIAYLHLSHMGDPLPKKFELFKEIRFIYQGTLIKCGDYIREYLINIGFKVDSQNHVSIQIMHGRQSRVMQFILVFQNITSVGLFQFCKIL